MPINKEAISTLIIIILILCSAVFGAFLSYLWVMANYYKMPENTTFLVVKDVIFPVNNATYFNVTILNPSNSISDANITQIRLNVHGKNETLNITTTEPSLPFLIRRGTEQTFSCKENWGYIAGETVTVEPVLEDDAGGNYSYSTPKVTTPKVKMKLTPNFDLSQTVEYFTLTIENSEESVINLTISEIKVFNNVANVTPALPYVLAPNQGETFRVEQNWQVMMGLNVTLTVKTEEGYEASCITNELPIAILYLGEIKFDYADTSYFNLTVISSEDSNADATVNRINLTVRDEPPISLNTTYPTNVNVVPITLLRKQSVTIKCLWDWSTYRNEVITVNIYTKEGLTSPPQTARIPSEVVWNITDVKFDLDDTEHFLVNVKNMRCSLRDVTVNHILLNGTTPITMEPSSAILSNDTQEMFNCSISWREYIGKTANITVVTTEGSISRLLEIPAVELKIVEDNLVFGDFFDNATGIIIPYINITISNSNNSLYNVTIVQIIIQTRNDTYIIYNNATYRHDNNILYPRLHPNEYAPTGYPINIGENVTFVCSWNYESYLTQDPITVTVYTAEGFQVSKTWHPPTP
jgi:hypothetical protein